MTQWFHIKPRSNIKSNLKKNQILICFNVLKWCLRMVIWKHEENVSVPQRVKKMVLKELWLTVLGIILDANKSAFCWMQIQRGFWMKELKIRSLVPTHIPYLGTYLEIVFTDNTVMPFAHYFTSWSSHRTPPPHTHTHIHTKPGTNILTTLISSLECCRKH
jgi:hypothetical protein